MVTCPKCRVDHDYCVMRVDSEIISGVVHMSLSIYLTAEGNLGKPQLGEDLIIIASNEVISTVHGESISSCRRNRGVI
jgi:hypothetical protein